MLRRSFHSYASKPRDAEPRVPYDRLVHHYTKRACRLFPGWEADVVPVTVSLVNREDAKTIGMDIREPRQFLHDALPRAHRYLERFFHRIVNLPPPTALEPAGETPSARGQR